MVAYRAGVLLNDPALLKIGEEHGSTTAQVTLRCRLKRGDIRVP